MVLYFITLLIIFVRLCNWKGELLSNIIELQLTLAQERSTRLITISKRHIIEFLHQKTKHNVLRSEVGTSSQ